MRSILLLLSCVLITLAVNSCSEFLNQQPQTLTSSSAFDTKEGAYKELLAVYHRSMINQSYNFFWGIGDVGSDDALKGGSGPSDQAQLYQIMLFKITDNNGALANIWKYAYQGIHRANLVIKNVPDVKDLDKSKANRYVAEAKFLRAFFYFRLVKIFGAVPLITKPNLKSYEVARSSKDSTYKLIERDAKAAGAVLPPRSGLSKDQVGRATEGASEALLTRVYLMQGNFSATEKWAKKIIDSGEYSLNPDYFSIFTEAKDHGPEAIFSINYAYNKKYPSSLDGMTTADDTYKRSRAFSGYGFDLPTQDLHDAFEPNDPRLKATMYANGDTLPDGRIGDVDNSSTGYIDKKAYIPKDKYHAAASGKDNKIFRLGEIYLWYAEAANEEGHTQAALKALNKVRERAREGNPNILPNVTTSNKKSLRQKIYHEERVEYAMEAKRFFDLVRTRRAAEVLHTYAKKYDTNKGANFEKDVNDLFPVPQSQIELSHGALKQNPGYN